MLSELEDHMHGKVNIIQFSCSVILTHLQSAFPMESGKIFWDWSLGLLQFWSEGYFPDNSLSILKTSIRSMSFKMILSKHARAALFLNHVYFPLGTPLYHKFWCFPTSSSCSSQSSHIFCQPPCCLHDCRWWNFTALGFFLLSPGDDSQHGFSTTFFLFPTSLKRAKLSHSVAAVTNHTALESFLLFPLRFIQFPVIITPHLTEPNIPFQCRQRNLSFLF